MNTLKPDTYRTHSPEQTINNKKNVKHFCVSYRYIRKVEKTKNTFFLAFAFRRSARTNVCLMISAVGRGGREMGRARSYEVGKHRWRKEAADRGENLGDRRWCE